MTLRVMHVADAMVDLHSSVGGAEHIARRLLDPDILSMTGSDPVLVTTPLEHPSPFAFAVETPVGVCHVTCKP